MSPTEHAENKRELIIKEASRMMYERGTGLGVDTLVSEIGVAKMTLYKHFPTKTDLIVACLHHLDDCHRARLSGEVDWSSSPKERLLSVFDSLREWFASPSFRGCAFVNATVELADTSPPVRKAVREHKNAMRAWVVKLVEECELPNADFVAGQIAQLMEGATTTALLERDPAVADIAHATALQVLEKAKEATASPPPH
ncbi:TetR/AcrR family transcriptional regulator [Saccharopolyspora sp. NPDC049357]|uniref:TetR/AcrR family transcriptional regulator n=1 Tax=Saccharopolyspora sp. NPDC049357 TaxID=3154507 RepID=UPI003419643A